MTASASPVAGGIAGATLVGHLARQESERPQAPAMRFWTGSSWAPITWRQAGEASRRLAAFLVDQGVLVHDHVAIWSSNRPEWHLADAAVLRLRARPVPVYLTSSAEQAAYVLGHSEAVAAVVEEGEPLRRLLEAREHCPDLRVVIVIGTVPAGVQGAVSWTEALRRGDAALGQHASEIDQRSAESRLEDIATLIYTSGTTGPPKAVLLTHRNVVAAVEGLSRLGPADADDRVLSYLPLAHIAERMNGEFRQYVFGNCTWFSRGLDRLADDLREVRPTIFFAVPRIWEKMADRVRAGVASSRGPRGLLARAALRSGARTAQLRRQGRTPGALGRRAHGLAEALVLGRMRHLLGLDQARLLGSGAAPISAEVLEFFDSLGLEILEIYGQTEDCGVTTCNRPGAARLGTVGQAVPGVEVRLAEDGEILVRGDVVFAGYHRDPEATAQALDDGWLRTGDVGEFDADGYLRITDRKKDLIITAGGKNISPASIEAALQQRCPLIGTAVAIGDRRPYITALLFLDAEEVASFLRARGAEVPEDPATDAAVVAEVERCVGEVNARLSNVEQVKRWRLLSRELAVGEELTPTLKVRRRVVTERYAADIDSLYVFTDRFASTR